MNSKVFGSNVKRLRLSLGMVEAKFANMVGFSRGTLLRVEGGLHNSNPGILLKIRNFFFMFGNEMFEEVQTVPNGFKKLLIEHHQINNPNYLVCLKETPDLLKAITEILLPSGFLDDWKEIYDIKEEFERYDWHYEARSILIALKRKQHLVRIEPHALADGLYICKRKKIEDYENENSVANFESCIDKKSHAVATLFC